MASPSMISRDAMFASSLPLGTATISPMQEDVDAPMWAQLLTSPPHPASPLPSSLSRRADTAAPHAEPVVKAEELTSSPDFRNSRYPVLPRPTNPHSTTTNVAIPTPAYNTSTTRCQDVPRNAVNSAVSYQSSTAQSTDVYALLETNVSNFPSSSTHVVNQRPRQRPRTSSQVFTSSHDLVAHYGLPQSLPPAPSTAPRRTQPQPESASPSQPAIANFSSLASNYLNMLAQKPTDNTMDTSPVQTVSPADLFAPNHRHEHHEPEMQDLVDIMLNQGSYSISDMHLDMSAHHPSSSPEMRSPVSPDLRTPELLSSPDFGGDFLSSPAFNTPYDDFLTTPVIGDDPNMFTDPMDAASYGGEMTLFPEFVELLSEKPVIPAPPPINSKMYMMSPASPSLHDFHTFTPSINPASIYPSPRLPSDRSSFPPTSESAPTSATSTTRRKSSATGTRKGVTPEALVPIDAPTQPRKYLTPSATSRKEVPSVFARKRTRVQAFGEQDEDELAEEPLRPDATELEQIEYKRRQNTVAARRSRKRKLEFQQKLIDENESLSRSRDMWKTRTQMLVGMMQARGLPCPTFPDEEDEA